LFNTGLVLGFQYIFHDSPFHGPREKANIVSEIRKGRPLEEEEKKRKKTSQVRVSKKKKGI